MTPSRRTMFIVYEVPVGSTSCQAAREVRRIAMRHQRTASPQTHVYIRMHGEIPDAVVLFFHNNVPTASRCQYVGALQWLMQTGTYEILDTARSAA